MSSYQEVVPLFLKDQLGSRQVQLKTGGGKPKCTNIFCTGEASGFVHHRMAEIGGRFNLVGELR